MLYLDFWHWYVIDISTWFPGQVSIPNDKNPKTPILKFTVTKTISFEFINLSGPKISSLEVPEEKVAPNNQTITGNLFCLSVIGKSGVNTFKYRQSSCPNSFFLKSVKLKIKMWFHGKNM